MDRTPPRIPSSWYVVAYSDEIPPGELRRLQLLGQEMVAFRAADGAVSVLDAYCPHLGAHFAVGGRIEDGTLRCPFHGWRFDGSGTCVEIPYASRIPPRARVPRHTSVEQSGLLLVWYDEAGRPPFFAVPELPEWKHPAWSKRWTRYEWTLRTHPQEMVENGLDWHHFPTVHRMDPPRNPRFRFEGPSYSWGIDAGKDYTLQEFREDFDLGGENWGLGYSVTRQKGAFETCVVTGITPIDASRVCIKLGVIARRGRESDAELERALAKYVEEHAVVATQDFEIWEHKLYRPSPLLCEEDGPIAEYRRWVRQFYVDGDVAPA